MTGLKAIAIFWDVCYNKYVEMYPKADTARERFGCIDRLIHEFHYSSKQNPGVPTRSVGANLIEGALADTISL